MAKKVQGSRFIHKYSEDTSVVPTIPIIEDHTDPSWVLETDIYKGELFFNIEDNKAWTRTDNGIIKVAMYDDNDFNIDTNSVNINGNLNVDNGKVTVGESVSNDTIDIGFNFAGNDIGIIDNKRNKYIGAFVDDNYLYGTININNGISVSNINGNVGIKESPDPSYALNVNGIINSNWYYIGGAAGLNGTFVFSDENGAPVNVTITRGIITNISPQ